MQSRDFAFWLQGLFELHPEVVTTGLTPHQTALVKQHLGLVFKHDADIDQAACEHVTLPDGQKQQPLPPRVRPRKHAVKPLVPPRVVPNEPWRMHDFPDHPRNRPIAIC
jgi:hypothetical protein